MLQEPACLPASLPYRMLSCHRRRRCLGCVVCLIPLLLAPTEKRCTEKGCCCSLSHATNWYDMVTIYISPHAYSLDFLPSAPDLRPNKLEQMAKDKQVYTAFSFFLRTKCKREKQGKEIYDLPLFPLISYALITFSVQSEGHFFPLSVYHTTHAVFIFFPFYSVFHHPPSFPSCPSALTLYSIKVHRRFRNKNARGREKIKLCISKVVSLKSLLSFLIS